MRAGRRGRGSTRGRSGGGRGTTGAPREPQQRGRMVANNNSNNNTRNRDHDDSDSSSSESSISSESSEDDLPDLLPARPPRMRGNNNNSNRTNNNNNNYSRGSHGIINDSSDSEDDDDYDPQLPGLAARFHHHHRNNAGNSDHHQRRHRGNSSSSSSSQSDNDHDHNCEDMDGDGDDWDLPTLRDVNHGWAPRDVEDDGDDDDIPGLIPQPIAPGHDDGDDHSDDAHLVLNRPSRSPLQMITRSGIYTQDLGSTPFIHNTITNLRHPSWTHTTVEARRLKAVEQLFKDDHDDEEAGEPQQHRTTLSWTATGILLHNDPDHHLVGDTNRNRRIDESDDVPPPLVLWTQPLQKAHDDDADSIETAPDMPGLIPQFASDDPTNDDDDIQTAARKRLERYDTILAAYATLVHAQHPPKRERSVQTSTA